MNENKIVITQDDMHDVFKSKRNVNEILAKNYEGIIADKIKANEKFKNVSPLKMAMIDAGIDMKSTVQDMTTSEAGEWLLPAYIDTRLRETIGNSDILKYVSNGEISISSTVVKTATLDLFNDSKNNKNIKLSRVSAGADIPTAELRLGEKAINLYKLGRAVEYTYETLMFMEIPIFTKVLEALGNDVALQGLDRATDVIVNGDGNDNAIKSVLTTETENKITNAELLKAVREFYMLGKLPVTTIIANGEMFDALMNMKYNTTEDFGASGRLLFKTPQFDLSNVALLTSEFAKTKDGKNQIILLNSTQCLNKYVANGSMIEEYQKNIRNQTELKTISEISAFAKFNNNACASITSI